MIGRGNRPFNSSLHRPARRLDDLDFCRGAAAAFRDHRHDNRRHHSMNRDWLVRGEAQPCKQCEAKPRFSPLPAFVLSGNP
jgi:hypothetical protein